MDVFLITARAVHFAATISLAGVFVFERCIVAPVFAQTDAAVPERLSRQLHWLAWASLVLTGISGSAWLLAVASDMTGRPEAVLLSLHNGWESAMLHTQFGSAWTVRGYLEGPIVICLFLWQRSGRVGVGARWAALLFAVPVLAGIARGGHGAATPGAAGELHLAGDILHLLGAGGWLGTLLPFALLLVVLRSDDSRDAAVLARRAARRFTVLAFVSVAILLFGGIVNTWFLAGTIPALVGTVYGRLLLAKIALFLGTLVIAAVNLLRLSPRLADAGGIVGRALVWMRRNALAEASLGLAVLAIVAVIGTLPPGLHTEPGWPFPYRLDFAVLSEAAVLVLALLLAAAAAAAVAAVACGAAGRYRTMAACAVAAVVCVGALWPPLRSAVEPAFPTSFYAPAEPYSAPSVAQGATVYAADCALCHGAEGKGDGPGAAGLPVHPANLVAPHLFAHTPGDLFWWVGHGRANGAMPGFGAVLTPNQRWDVVNFIRARAAGVLSRGVGPAISTAAAPTVPDFAFEANGAQSTLRRVLAQGPALLVLFSPPAPQARLAELAKAQPQFEAAGLHVVAVELAPDGEGKLALPLTVEAASTVRAMLALFRGPQDGVETELLLDRNGDIRARWTAAGGQGLPDTAALEEDARSVAAIAVAAPSHAGHGG